MKTILPHVTYGTDAFATIHEVTQYYGRKCALIYGEKAFKAAQKTLLPSIAAAELIISTQFCYGHEATFANVQKITADPAVQQADFLFAVGGGKCIDTVKCAGSQLKKPVITIPTIASTCAAVTKLSVMYHDDGTFSEIVNYDEGPAHCFINTQIIAESPDVYLWAGIGDTLAKYIECTFSARHDTLTFEQEFGVNASRLCFYPMIADGARALAIKKTKKVSEELTKVILNIIVSTGVVSICVGKDYNSALAHALNYGFSCRRHIEKNHYHGEVVSYGALVQLIMDEQFEDFLLAFPFYQAIGLPTKLADLELAADDPLEDVLAITVVNNELEHVPYPVTKEKIVQAIHKLESYNQTQQLIR